MSKRKIIGAIEIGTAKVVVLVGEVVGGRSLNIVGMAQCSSRGVVKGVIHDFKQASDCVHAAILSAEERSGARIEGVYLAQSGGHLEGFFNEASVTVSSADNLVSETDIETVCRIAKSKALPDDRTVVHHIRRPFRLDGRIVGDPELLEGRRLEAGYWTVHGAVNRISDSIHIINGFSLHVDDLILSSLASGLMTTTPTDRENGVLVIDIGCGTSDYVLYRDGRCYMTGVLPVGGDHLTNDLCIGLRVNRSQAEKLKRDHGSCLVDSAGKSEKVWLNGDMAIGDRQIPLHSIQKILHARAQEQFSVIKARLGKAWNARDVAGGVVLTGGGAKLPGSCDIAAAVFEAPVRLGEAPGWVKEELRDLEYSTVLGLLNYGLSAQDEKDTENRKRPGLLRRMTRIFS